MHRGISLSALLKKYMVVDIKETSRNIFLSYLLLCNVHVSQTHSYLVSADKNIKYSKECNIFFLVICFFLVFVKYNLFALMLLYVT